MRDDSDLIWMNSSVPISAFAFPNFTRHTTMAKWMDASDLQVKGLIGSRAQLPLHVVPEVVMESIANPLDAPAMVPWAPHPLNMGWSRFWSVSTPIFNFMDPWDNLKDQAGEVYVQRWIFFPRHRKGQGVTIWANYNLRDTPVVNEPAQGWTDPQVSLNP